jgi:hypothetical protein
LKEITMTTAAIALAELAEKGADIDVLRRMGQFMAQRQAELDTDGRCGARSTTRSPPSASTDATATATVLGRPEPAALR